MGFLRWDKLESLLALVYLVYRAALYDSFSFCLIIPGINFLILIAQPLVQINYLDLRFQYIAVEYESYPCSPR